MSSILYSGPFDRVSSTLIFAISVSFADADLDTPIENLYPFTGVLPHLPGGRLLH